LTSVGATLARPAVSCLVLAGVVLLAFATTLFWLYAQYTNNIWQNPHSLFVPLFMVLLARGALRRAPRDPEPSASARGGALIALAALLLALDSWMKSQILSVLALVIALPGLSLILLGAPMIRHGTLFLLGEPPFEISQNCSGLTAVYETLGFAIMLLGPTRSA
jgi:hypothetical protein